MEVIASENRFLPDPRIEGFHRAQEVGSATSRVHPVTWGTDPLLDVVSSPSPSDTPLWLERWAAVLDSAYGYQQSPDHPRGVARRAPSAGALYPIEIFAVSRRGVFQYSFWTRRFHQAVVCDAEVASASLGLGADDLALVAVALFWRTIQRYGVRGYRYCMLDGGNVISNLIGAVRARGLTELALASPSRRLTHALALPMSVGVVRSLVVRGASRLADDTALVPAWTPPERTVAYEHSPLLSPLLQRVSRFHQEALEEVSFPVPASRPAIPELALAGRWSSRSFTDEAVPRAWHDEVRTLVGSRRPLLPVGPEVLRCYLVRVRVAGLAPGVERLEPDGRGVEVMTGGGPREYAARVQAMCQDQVIAGEAALALLIGAGGEVLRTASPPAYRDLLSEAGHLGAELGAQASARRFGTTTIGGFSDDSARQLTGDDDWYPIAIQLYGHSGRHGYKIDAASRVLENLQKDK